MSTPQQVTDQIESMDPIKPMADPTEPKALNSGTSKDQSISKKDEKKEVTPIVGLISSTTDISRDSQVQVSSAGGSGTDRNFAYQPNLYAPQAQTFFYGGYENSTGEWEEYPHYVNMEGLDVNSTVVYNEDPSLMYHTGYGYSPQMPYGPYSPVTTPLPAVSGDHSQHLYSPHPVPHQHFSLPGSVPTYPYSPGPISQNDQNPMLAVDPQATFFTDWTKSPAGPGSMAMFPSPVGSPQPVNTFGQSSISGMVTQNQKSYYGFGPPNSSYDRGYSHSGLFQNYGTNYGTTFSGSFSNLTINGRGSGSGSVSLDKGKRRGGIAGGKGNSIICSCNGALDFLNEQSRGPRASRPKKQINSDSAPDERKSEKGAAGANKELYNNPDFVTDYKNARFFIIKSYSEDNVHKSIKYGVWASTANGNRKLDSAYREAREKGDACPIFLFFSVNASAHFCGAAEMVGPVDFEKSVDYWQQDKWSGQFPVRWHLLKDVPNNLFRHIILENNDNKPVTNSRDTQEVKLEQGLEMLSIFKNHDSDMSILDDFEYYEERERAMQENRSRQLQLQQQQLPQLPLQLPNTTATSNNNTNNNNNNKSEPISGGVIGQISMNFARAVRVEENKVTENNETEENSIASSSVDLVSKSEDLMKESK